MPREVQRESAEKWLSVQFAFTCYLDSTVRGSILCNGHLWGAMFFIHRWPFIF